MYPIKNNIVIVAHPDDETLWCGGEMLLHPNDNWFVVSLCRLKDEDRAPKFKKALLAYQANGILGDLDDSPEQLPLNLDMVKQTIISLLPSTHFDLIITHNPFGEYTRHLRHEEVGSAVLSLWKEGEVMSKALYLFAYDDGMKSYNPRALEEADIYNQLPKHIWNEKYRIITDIYGFNKQGFEAQTTPKTEAFWKFSQIGDAQKWLEQRRITNNHFKSNL